MRNTLRISITITASVLVVACATGPRVGQKATVQFGVVRNADRVTLADSTATDGALIGGMFGLTAGRGSSSRRARTAIVGASVGAAAGAAAERNRMGMRYTVDLLDGSSARIVTDQTEIRPGDCVALERVRDTANIRRASASFCDPANREAVASAEPVMRADAAACERAKRDFADATTESEADLAVRRVELLCNS